MGGRRRAYAHDARQHTHAGHAHDPGFWREAVPRRARLVGQQQRAGAVIHTRGVAGGYRAIRAHDALELGECLQAGLARVFVLAHQQRIAFLLGNAHWCDLGLQACIFLCHQRIALRAPGHLVLRLARDAEICGHVLGGFGHAVHAIGLLHQPVDKAPADGGVVDRIAAAKSAVHLGHNEGGAAHALDAAGNHQAGLARADCPRRRAHRVQARPAQAVDGGTGHLNRQAGEQRGHVRHIAVVLPGLVGAAKQYVAHSTPINPRVAGHQRLERDGTEVVGSHAAQRASVATKRGADGVANKSLFHALC